MKTFRVEYLTGGTTRRINVNADSFHKDQEGGYEFFNWSEKTRRHPATGFQQPIREFVAVVYGVTFIIEVREQDA